MFNLKEKELKTGIMLLTIGGIIYFLLQIKTVLLPFFAGILLAYLLFPILDYLSKRNIPKTWAVYILAITFLFISIVISVLVVPVFLNELAGLSSTMPEYIKVINNFINKFIREYRNVNVPSTIKEAINRTLRKTEEGLINFMEGLTDKIISSLTTFFSLLITPIITYYILRDLDKLKRSIMKWIPKSKRRLFFKIGVEINKVILGYLRGQIWISIIVGILSSIGLLFFNVPFFLLLGLFAGICNMVPYIGPVIGSIPAIFLALLTSPGKAVSIGVLFFIIQQLENSLISPRIISGEVGIHPLVVIFSLLVGAELFGIWGLLLAIPLAGCLKVIGKIIYTEFYPQ